MFTFFGGQDFPRQYTNEISNEFTNFLKILRNFFNFHMLFRVDNYEAWTLQNPWHVPDTDTPRHSCMRILSVLGENLYIILLMFLKILIDYFQILK